MSGDVKHTNELGPTRVRINRDDAGNPTYAGPFANLVKGSATQITPNGVARDEDPSEAFGITGSKSGFPTPTMPTRWPGGNRSGE